MATVLATVLLMLPTTLAAALVGGSALVAPRYAPRCAAATMQLGGAPAAS